MRICIVTPTFFPEPGGPSTFVKYFAASLNKDRHQITIIAVSDSDGMVQDKEGYSIVSIRRNGFRVLRLVKTVIAVLKHGKESDVIFSCGLFLECAFARMFLNKPLLVRIGGDPVWEKWTNQKGVIPDLRGFQNKRYSLRTEVKKYLQRLSCRSADKVITPSYFFKTIMETWGIAPEKIQVVYNGVNEEEIKLPPKEELRETFHLQGMTIILTIGRLIQYKRIDGIIESFSETKGDNLYLFVIGGGYKRKELEELSQKLNLGQRVKFLGNKNHKEVLEYLKAADIFVLNSVDEVMPNVVLESLALGTPVVAPNAGGIPEIIQEKVDGLLYPLKKDNKHELREAVERLLRDDGLREQIKKNGLVKAERFSWERTYEETLSVMNTV